MFKKIKNTVVRKDDRKVQDIMAKRISNFLAYKCEELFREGETVLTCRELARRFYANMPMHVSNNRETHIALTNVKYALRSIEKSHNCVKFKA